MVVPERRHAHGRIMRMKLKARQRSRVPKGKIIFITGTDTGVGKTVLTALLCCHLRSAGIKVRAIKPVCCGDRADIEILRLVQPEVRNDREINRYFFKEPIAPALAAERHGRSLVLKELVKGIQEAAQGTDLLLVEGVGGLMVPLGQGFFVKDLIEKLGCDVIVVGRNKLGTINHTLLTVKPLQTCRCASIKVVLMGARMPDDSSSANAAFLSGSLAITSVYELPFLGQSLANEARLRSIAKKNAKTLALILDFDTFSVVLLNSGCCDGKESLTVAKKIP